LAARLIAALKSLVEREACPVQLSA